MTVTDYITDAAAQLTDWGINYRETYAPAPEPTHS